MFEGWFGGSKKPDVTPVASAPASTPSTSAAPAKPKPCCVCKEEKQRRDECMLMNEDGEKACVGLIQEYKNCMKGFGFEV